MLASGSGGDVVELVQVAEITSFQLRTGNPFPHDTDFVIVELLH